MIAADEGIAARLAADRHRLLGRFERAVRHARRRTDPEAVHDVRVATRQLQAALDLWRSILPRRRRRRARRALRRLRRALAPAREVRICLELLRERFEELSPEARIAAALLQDVLQRRLDALEARAARRCGRAEMERLRSRFERAFEETTTALESGPGAIEAARLGLEARRAVARDALRMAARGASDEALHGARLAVKRWRYLLERFAAANPAADRSERRWLRSVQESLGRIQDLAVLRERITRLGPPGAASESLSSPEALHQLLVSFEARRAECVREFVRLAAEVDREPLAMPPIRAGARWGDS